MQKPSAKLQHVKAPIAMACISNLLNGLLLSV